MTEIILKKHKFQLLYIQKFISVGGMISQIQTFKFLEVLTHTGHPSGHFSNHYSGRFTPFQVF